MPDFSSSFENVPPEIIIALGRNRLEQLIRTKLWWFISGIHTCIKKSPPKGGDNNLGAKIASEIHRHPRRSEAFHFLCKQLLILRLFPGYDLSVLSDLIIVNRTCREPGKL